MSCRHLYTLALAVFLLSACSGPMKLTRLAQAPAVDGKKVKIKKIVDLGAQELPLSGEFKVKDSDGHLSPGEWVAVCGEGLDAEAGITLGATQAKVEGYLKNGLLFRVPRGIDPRTVSRLAVKTASGSADKKIKLRSYIATADRRGDHVRFMHLTPKGLDGKVRSKKFKTMGPQAFSPDGARLFVLGRSKDNDDAKAWAKGILKSVVKEPERVELPVRVFAMGAKGGPKKAGEFSVGLDSEPTRMLSPAPGQLLVLSEGHLLWLDLDESLRPSENGRLDLRGDTRRTCYAHMQLSSPENLVLLDPCTNGLLRVDMSGGGLQLTGEPKDLAPGSDLPLSLGMAAEPGQPELLWVLQGPNFLIPREEMHRGLAKLKGGAMKLLAPLTGKREETADGPRRSHVHSRVLKIRVGETGPQVEAELALPEKFFPMAVAALGGERVAVAGLNGNVFEFAGIKANLKGLKKLVKMLLKTVQLGRVIELKEGAEPKERFRGLAIYFQAERLSDDIPVGVLRPVAKKFPPGVDVKWGLELGSKFVGLRSLDFKSLLPPYVFAPILFQ